MTVVGTEWIEAEVLKAVPDAMVEVIDLHRSGDHFHVRVISESFDGMRPLQRQKLVLAVMKQHIPRPIHALDRVVFSPRPRGQGPPSRTSTCPTTPALVKIRGSGHGEFASTRLVSSWFLPSSKLHGFRDLRRLWWRQISSRLSSPLLPTS